jgi:preprotein translocase subunit SecD
MLYFSRWKALAILAAALATCLLAVPNFFSPATFDSLPKWAQRHITLGLDLQGGSHMLLEVDSGAVRREKIENLRDDIRRLLREERIGYTGLAIQGDAVQVRIREANEIERAVTKLRELTRSQTGAVFGAGAQPPVSLSQGDNGLIVMTVTESGITERVRQAVDQSIEIVRRRIDELGTTEPLIQRQGLDRIMVQVPGLQDPQRLKELLGRTAKLTFRMVDMSMSAEQAIQTRPPAESEVLYSRPPNRVPYLIERAVVVSGEDLVDAQPGFDQRTSEPIVTFRFNANGGRKFGQATVANVGRPFAIVLDAEVISAPVIREPILGGSGQISGGFTVQEANDLAILLRAGALPAPLNILEERTVGPGLGQDSIQAGQWAAWIGAFLVIAFMIATYGIYGVIANAALIINVGMILGIMSLLGATLTLPGIAGIVLTIGMAVDSNVLIYERIREEARAGKSAIGAIDTGFQRALGTILDANITTLIAAMILFYLGTGPVRGFALTLAIGILTTVFTAFTFTRLMVAWYVRAKRPVRVAM